MRIPERGEDYGREVWARLAPRLDEHIRPRWQEWLSAAFAPRNWAIAGAMAVLVVGAFIAGRFWPHQGRTSSQPITAQARERILVVAVGEHFDRSQMVLLEFMNAPPDGQVDITAEQARAEELVAANRLYRQAATHSGDSGLADVLDDLERTLLEIARSPSRLSSQEFQDLRQRIEAQGIVFKVRVIDSKLQEKGSTL